MTRRVPRPPIPRALRAAAAAASLALAAAAPLAAQLPGVPAAPSAFVRPGVALAANAGLEQRAILRLQPGGESWRSRWTYGGAAAFAPASGRWQVAGGVAAQSWGEGYRDPATAFGARAAWAVWRGARVGATAVGGIGFARAGLDVPDGTVVADSDDVVLARQLPVGVALGVRGAWGAGRAWALSVTPQYVWYRLSYGDDAVTDARARVGVLAEAALTPRLGLAVALEDGGRAGGGEPGPRGATAGVALSLALGRR